MTAQLPPGDPNAAFPVRDRLSDTPQASETLSALDWTDYRCACTHHPGGCSNRAGYVVSVHAIHRCSTAGLDPFGNQVEIRCAECVQRLHATVRDSLNRLLPWGSPPCQSCGAPITRVSDVVRFRRETGRQTVSEMRVSDFPNSYKLSMIRAYRVIAQMDADEEFFATPGELDEAFGRILASRSLRRTHEMFLAEQAAAKKTEGRSCR